MRTPHGERAHAQPAGTRDARLEAMGTAHLSSRDLARLRARLEQKRTELLAAERASRREGRGVTDNAIEDEDVAERMIEQESALRQAGFDAALLADIDRAIAKLEAGTYGLSEDTGAPIPLERLEALPWARRTAPEEDVRRRGSRP
jgi:DnaK suppressor protein